MLNSTFTVFTCISLFTKHNYRAKKLNYLTLKSSIQNEWTLVGAHVSIAEKHFKKGRIMQIQKRIIKTAGIHALII
jgi:hypothetical protein